MTVADVLLRRVDLARLYPPFVAKLRMVLEECAVAGRQYWATSGYRGFEEQSVLYQKHLMGGPRAVRPGFSAHNYGIAVDLAPDSDPLKPGLQGPDYSAAAYAMLGEKVAAAGLVWGNAFGDRPHVQVRRFVSGAQLTALALIHGSTKGDERMKLNAVWKYLDTKLVV